jgi:hypothetical protein
MWFSSEEPLDLLSLFAAPYLLSDACRLFPALPFFILVLSNPRFERVELLALRRSDRDEVEEGYVTPQLLSQCECLALVPITIDASAFRLAQELRDPLNIVLDVLGVIR